VAIHHVDLCCGLRLFGTAKLLRITAVDSISVFLARLEEQLD
jgi:hypothetical protein